MMTPVRLYKTILGLKTPKEYLSISFINGAFQINIYFIYWVEGEEGSFLRQTILK